MSEELEPQNQGNSAGDSVAEADGDSDKLVPVSESIKYRRRAQQAEGRFQQAQQQLGQLQQQIEQRLDQLATAEAQRDELQHQLDTQCLRHVAEKALLKAGADVETAMALLEKRLPLSEQNQEQLEQAVGRLLDEKPFLLAPAASLPGKTASARQVRPATGLTRAASAARGSGNRRDLAEYLRLRRTASSSR